MIEIDLKILACLSYISKILSDMTCGVIDTDTALMRHQLGKSLIELTEVMEKDDGKE